MESKWGLEASVNPPLPPAMRQHPLQMEKIFQRVCMSPNKLLAP